MKKYILSVSLAGMSLWGLSSCSKGGNPLTPIPDLNKVKTAKFTVQVIGLESNDYASFSFSVGNAGTTFWKVNGTERPNEQVVAVDEDDLISGATYIIETTQPVTAISAGYQFTNGDNNLHSPIKFSYKAEINGKVVKDIKNQEIEATDQLIQDYSYTE